MGDPAGCGPQITADAWAKLRAATDEAFFVIGDPRLYDRLCPIALIDQPVEAVSVFSNALPVLPIEIAGYEALKTGTPLPSSGSATIESIKCAVDLAVSKKASAVVTNPIAKSVLYETGFKHPGHTEFIADLCNMQTEQNIRPVMMLVGGGLRVSLATIHVPLMRVLDQLTPDTLKEIAEITFHAMRRDFGIATPQIALTGLNPHAGEDGNIGTEERDLINPVARALRAKGISVTDARSADTVFHEALSGQYDAVIAMTHDQGLIPVKTLDMWGGVNTTLGLPIVRTSPDHGTAFDAAAAGTCRSDSLIAAIHLAQDMVANRTKSDG